jgi:triosephosphate isomerase
MGNYLTCYTFLMIKRTVPIIVGNWKTTPASYEEAAKFIKQLDKKCLTAKGKKGITIPKKAYYLAVPDIFISPLTEITKFGYIGSQNVGGVALGQETGLTLPSMLHSGGASFTIIGHSEVRARGETVDERAHKVALSLQSKLTTILCVGEQTRDASGNYLAELEEDVKSCLSLVSRNLFENLIIAYEPVWAIGKSVPATPSECFEAVIALRRALASLAGIDYAKKVHLIYGGAVTGETAKVFLQEGGVDGLLIGRASQQVATFIKIITVCHTS